jgi:hypothetical protein
LDPYAFYNRDSWIAAVGHGASRERAERTALTALTAFFGQSIQSELQAVTASRETVLNGAAAASSQTSEIVESLRVAVNMDALVGAEIRDVWYDQQGVYYAAAVMEKAAVVKLYTALINSNIRIIDELTALPDTQKYSLDGVVNYMRAAATADASAVFINVLSTIGSAGDFGGIKKGDEYRIEAAEIIKRIPIQVRVANDRSDRVRGAFAEVLTQMGFRTGGGSRYMLDVKTVFSEVVLDSPYKWVRYEISADLTDTGNGVVLLPYSITDRLGHTQLEEAEKRAVAGAEKEIRQSYGELFLKYLDRSPDKRGP